jgi:hypothetical protein
MANAGLVARTKWRGSKVGTAYGLGGRSRSTLTRTSAARLRRSALLWLLATKTLRGGLCFQRQGQRPM